jgi:4-amino-4-deoxychorismate lyase
MLECLINGEISSHLPVADRGLHYGDGIFETILLQQGQPLFWQLHMDRLQTGCQVLGLNPVAQNILLREVQTVSAGRAKCVVKIILTRGSSGRGYAPESGTDPQRLVMAYEAPRDMTVESDTGIRARICDLRLGFQTKLSGLKHLNRLEQVMARAEWSDPTIYEGILLDREDHVISGVSCNIFLVSGRQLLTPRMDRCGVRGVMRSAILNLFGSRCEQRRVKLDMLPEAEEVFICNSVRGVLPVRQIDHWEYVPGPVTREIQAWVEQQ